ncbi:MAG: tRNA pseudouridine(38-40) synthase TruA [Miltoncostaeaceae bacterium]
MSEAPASRPESDSGLRSFRLDLEYDGTGFAGWAAQPGRRTVEGVLREALDRVLPGGYRLAVAGRTDAGVHAAGQVASVAAPTGISSARLRGALMGLLPEDCVAATVWEMEPGFDARRDAAWRRYEYRVLPGPRSPLRRDRVLVHPPTLDLERLNSAASRAVGRHDFRAFTPSHTLHTTFSRRLTRCVWDARGDELVLTVQGDTFLRHMVRVLVGTMLWVGRGVLPPEHMEHLLAGAPRGDAGPTAPAHALTLVEVGYEDAVTAGLGGAEAAATLGGP